MDQPVNKFAPGLGGALEAQVLFGRESWDRGPQTLRYFTPELG